MEHHVDEFKSNFVSTQVNDLDYIVTKNWPTRAEMLGLGIVHWGMTGDADKEIPLTKEALLALITRWRKATCKNKPVAIVSPPGVY